MASTLAASERQRIATFYQQSEADSFQWDDAPEPPPPPAQEEGLHITVPSPDMAPPDPTWRHLQYLEAARSTGGLSPGGIYTRRKSNIEKGQYGPQLSPVHRGVTSDSPCSPSASFNSSAPSPPKRLFDAETGKWVIRGDPPPTHHQSAPPIRAHTPARSGCYATTTGSSFFGSKSSLILPPPHAPYTDALLRKANNTGNSDLAKYAPGNFRSARGSGSSFMTFRQ